MAIYFPVLRWKQGERGALAHLTAEVKEQIAPIIEFPLNCEQGDRKFMDFCDTAEQDWGIRLPFYLDLSAVVFEEITNEANHPAYNLLRDVQQQQLIPIPVISTDMDPELLNSIQQAYAS